MKKLSVRSLLMGLVLSLFLTQAWTTPTVKADVIGNCSDPFVLTVPRCILWGLYCWGEEQACVDCQDGRHCYPMY